MPGGYFITLCTPNRDHLFGDFVGMKSGRPDTNDRFICTGDRSVAPTISSGF
jgi:hypothetical protein